MPDRWTKKQLKEIDLTSFIKCIIAERRNNLKNHYSPLGDKLGEAYSLIDKLTGIESKIKCQACTSFIDTMWVKTKQVNGSAVRYCPCCGKDM